MSAVRARQFRLAVERQDCAAIAQSFADGFVLLNPASSRPFKGRTLGSGLVHAARRVLEGFRYTDLLETEHCAVLVFEADIGARRTFATALHESGHKLPSSPVT